MYHRLCTTIAPTFVYVASSPPACPRYLLWQQQKEETDLRKKLPTEELALAEEQRELEHMVARDAAACSPTAAAATADTAADTAPRRNTDFSDTCDESAGVSAAGSDAKILEKWGTGQLLSDDSDGDNGVEEMKFSGPPLPQPAAAAVAQVAAVNATEKIAVWRGTAEEARDGPSGAAEAARRALVGATDLLADEDYVDLEPATPPAIADWILDEASDGRNARVEELRAWPHGRGYGLETDRGTDDDSFYSGCDGGYREDDDNDSDADSEARLTALVTKLAMRGVKSRAAMIVQAMARGRRARRSFAAMRANLDAENAALEEARCVALEARAARENTETRGMAPAPAQADSRSVPAGTRILLEEDEVVDGDALQEPAWLASRERQEALSDSFGSSDAEEEGAGVAKVRAWGGHAGRTHVFVGCVKCVGR